MQKQSDVRLDKTPNCHGHDLFHWQEMYSFIISKGIRARHFVSNHYPLVSSLSKPYSEAVVHRYSTK